jgi:hypothetical protein
MEDAETMVLAPVASRQSTRPLAGSTAGVPARDLDLVMIMRSPQPARTQPPIDNSKNQRKNYHIMTQRQEHGNG